jgi:hypothetical protein
MVCVACSDSFCAVLSADHVALLTVGTPDGGLLTVGSPRWPLSLLCANCSAFRLLRILLFSWSTLSQIDCVDVLPALLLCSLLLCCADCSREFRLLLVAVLQGVPAQRFALLCWLHFCCADWSGTRLLLNCLIETNMAHMVCIACADCSVLCCLLISLMQVALLTASSPRWPILLCRLCLLRMLLSSWLALAQIGCVDALSALTAFWLC